MFPVLPVFVSSIPDHLPVLLAAVGGLNALATPLTFVILGASFFALAGVLRRAKDPVTEATQAASADVQTVHRVKIAAGARKMAPEPVKIAD